MGAIICISLNFFHLLNNSYFHNWSLQLRPNFTSRKKSNNLKLLLIRLPEKPERCFLRGCVLGEGSSGRRGAAVTHLPCCSAEKTASPWWESSLGTFPEGTESLQDPGPHVVTSLSQKEDVKHISNKRSLFPSTNAVSRLFGGAQ